MFENVSLIFRDRGLKQLFKETIEIKKILFMNRALKKDAGEYGLNYTYHNLLQSNKVNYIFHNTNDLSLPDNELSHKSSQSLRKLEFKELGICNCFEEN